MMVPYVIENTPQGERGMDLYSRLLVDRNVMLFDEVTHESANIIIAQLLFLESENPDGEISLYINSVGGSVVAGMAIVDTMRYIKCDVRTIVVGEACSMGSIIASSGTKGKRMMLKHSVHMIHQVMSGFSGQASDLQIHTNETMRWKDVLTKIYVENTGQDYDKIVQDTDRDNFLTAQKSIEYGLADEILSEKRP